MKFVSGSDGLLAVQPSIVCAVLDRNITARHISAPLQDFAEIIKNEINIKNVFFSTALENVASEKPINLRECAKKNELQHTKYSKGN